MRPLLIVLILVLTACASPPPKPERKLASVPEVPIYDHSKSQVQIFPAVAADNALWYYFYVETKNTKGKYFAVEPSEIEVRTHKGKKVPFRFEQLLAGRYYITLEKTFDISSAQLDVLVKGKPLKEQFKLNMRVPDKVHSKITLVKKTRNKIIFRLLLADKKDQPVEIPDKPEIILEGIGSVEEMRHVSEGTWEFSLIYPEENQIMYFSVRAMGIYLSNLYRYQHVEK